MSIYGIIYHILRRLSPCQEVMKINTNEDTIKMQLLTARFLRYCKAQKRLSDSTIRAYECDLRYFRIYLANLDPPITEPFKIDRFVMEDYLAELNKHVKVKTIKRKFAAFSAFFSYLEYHEIIKESPLAKFQLKIRDNPTLPNTILIGDVEKILRIVYNLPVSNDLGFRTKVRDIAIIELLFACGMRVSELTSLLLSDYNTQNHSLRILGKGSKERAAYITDEAALSAFESWIELRKTLNAKTPNIFLNRYNDFLRPISVRFLIHKYAEMAGLENRVTPHSFRHSFASSLLNEDVDSKYIQELLGHSSINTTQLYLHTTEEKKVELLKKSHPRKNMQVQIETDDTK